MLLVQLGINTLVLLIPNCTRQRMITYTNVSLKTRFSEIFKKLTFYLTISQPKF